MKTGGEDYISHTYGCCKTFFCRLMVEMKEVKGEELDKREKDAITAALISSFHRWRTE